METYLRTDEYTGDPRIRDLWEKTRSERHLLIRAMYGDPWSEQTAAQHVATVLSNAFWFLIGAPLLWAFYIVLILVPTAICIPYGTPIESVLGKGFSGGLGDHLMLLAAGLALLTAAYGVYRKTLGVAAKIKRLRGLTNTDLVLEYDRFVAAKERAARRDYEFDMRAERQQEADYLARRIGVETRKATAFGILDAQNGNGYTRWS